MAWIGWLGRLLPHLLIGAVCVVWLAPTIGLLVSSFRPASAVATTGWWTAFNGPLRFTLDNYGQVLGSRNLGLAFLNSLLVTVPAVILTVLLAAFAAYAFAWMHFPGRRVLFVVVVGLLVVPLQVTLVPLLRVFNETGLTGTFVGIWLAHAGFNLPFAVYLLRNFFASIPADLLESAWVDGASSVTTFTRIVLPTSLPAIASLAIFEFLWVWNDLLGALIFLGGRSSVAPMTVAVSNLVSSQGEGWQLLTAAAFLSMIVPLLVFFGLQRYFVRGILAGSVKG